MGWKSYELQEVPVPVAAPAAPRRGPIPTKLEPDEHIQDLGDAASPALAASAVGLLLAGIVALTIFAGPVTRFAEATADQLYNPSIYLHAVLEGQEGTK